MSVMSARRVLGLALEPGLVGAVAQAQDSTVSGGPSFSHIVGPPGPPRIFPIRGRSTACWAPAGMRRYILRSGRALFPEKHCWWVRG